MNNTYELPGGWKPMTPTHRPVYAWTRPLTQNPTTLELLYISYHEESSRASLLDDLCLAIDNYDPVQELVQEPLDMTEDTVSLDTIAQLIPEKYRARIRDRDKLLLDRIASMWQFSSLRQDYETIEGLFLEYGHLPVLILDDVKNKYPEDQWAFEAQLASIDPFVERTTPYWMYWVAMLELSQDGILLPDTAPYTSHSIDPARLIDGLTITTKQHADQIARIANELTPAFSTPARLNGLVDARNVNRLSDLISVAIRIHEEDFTPPVVGLGVGISTHPR